MPPPAPAPIPSPTPGGAYPAGSEDLRTRRLRQILNSAIIAIALVGLMGLTRQLWVNFGLDVLAIGLLMLARRWNERGRTQHAAAIMLVTLMALLCALMAFNEGLYDEAPLTYPGLLVFAAMFGSRRLFFGMLCWMLLTLAGFYVLHHTGLLLSVAQPPSLERLMVMGMIIATTGGSAWLLAADLVRTLAALERAHTDLAQEKQALEQSHAHIEELAHHDPLTRLPNRALAKDRLAQMLTRRQRDGGMLAILFLDLDNFKTINDSLGHAAGDDLLRQVAQRLCTCVRASDTVARQSGDEFLLLLADIQDATAIQAVANKVVQTLAEPFVLDGLDVVISASLGIAVAPRDGNDTDTLLKNADLAMYRAKDAGRNAWRFFDAQMNDGATEQLHLTTALRTALAEGQLQVHYQPQWDLRSQRIVGAEALVRWLHPEQGFISPARFIPVAERSGLINALGTWVLHQACQDASHWRAQGLGEVTVSINVSPAQLRHEGLERELAHALASCQLPAQAVELELTESLLVADAPHLSEALQGLRAMGIHIAIDDFGTGYSNLGYLRRFAVHRLKIDQSFVRQLGSSAQDEGLVRAIIEMAHCLGLEVVAEGVEDAGALHKLQAFGCEYAQGYHWAPALPLADFIALARQNA